jgi:hypothetical protein
MRKVEPTSLQLTYMLIQFYRQSVIIWVKISMTDYLTYHNDMCRGVYIAKDFLFLKDMVKVMVIDITGNHHFQHFSDL